MRITASTWIAISSFVCACASRPVAVEANELGITELEIRHDRLQDDRFLTVRGLDQAGEAVATVVVRTGMVMYGADMAEQISAGTELKLNVGDTTASFVSPDRIPHVIYEPLSSGAATFVALKAVAHEIDKEVGIRFAPPPHSASTEIALTTQACDGSRFPTAKGGSSQCCQDATNTYHVNASNAVVNRFTYAPAWPSIPVCRKSDGTTGCTTACLYGPCGSAVGTISGTNGHIFHPISNPNVCGRDDGAGVYSPEPYAGQTLYGGVTATCGCTGCNVDGTAQCGFSDNFNRTSGMGSSWLVSIGSFNTDGAKAVASSCGNCSSWAAALPSPAIGTNDYMVTAQVIPIAGADFAGVYGRNNTNNDGDDLYVAQIDESENTVSLYRRDSSWVHLNSGPPGTITAGTTYTLKLVAWGSNPVHLEGWLDGVQKVSFDDWSANRKTAGGAGILAYDTNVSFDSFQIDPTTPGIAPPPLSNGSPFIDDFTRTTGLGSNWQVRYGGFSTDGANAVSGPSSSSDNNFARVVADLGSNNYSVTTTLTVPSGAYWSGVFSRSAADQLDFSATLYAAQISTTSGGSVNLYRRNGYGYTLLGTYSTTITAGTQYTLKLVTTGSNPVHLEVWLNGVQRITYNDSSASRLTTGGHGIVSYKDNTNWTTYRADAI